MTLLESGAKSLATHYGLDWDDLPTDPQYQGVHDFHCKAFWLGMSRAYLEGIREPTEEMEDRGQDAGEGFGRSSDNETWLASGAAKSMWQAMVDAALKETPK